MQNLDQKERGSVNLIWQCFLPVILYYVIHNAAAILGFSVMEMMKTKTALEFIMDSVWFYIETFVKMAAMALGGLAVYPYFKHEKSDKIPGNLGWQDMLLLTGGGSVLSLGMNFLFSVTGFTTGSEQYQQVAEAQFALPLWLGCIFYGILSPVVEEMVFRGIVYNALCRCIAEKMAIFGSAILFGAFHGNIVQMVYAGVMGVVMAKVYQKYQNLLAPILFHGTANITVYVLDYFF